MRPKGYRWHAERVCRRYDARRIGYQSSGPPSGMIAMLFGNAHVVSDRDAAGRSRPHRVGEARCYLPASVGSRVMNQLVTPRTSASAVTW